MLQPLHADQDIYAAKRLSSRLEIHISFSSIISNMYRYTVNIQYSILVYQTHYLRPKSSLRARLASSDWVTHLPLVMLGLRSSPKKDSGFSPGEAVYGSNLSLPGEFLEHSEIPPENFLHKVELALQGFSGPPQHHVTPQP